MKILFIFLLFLTSCTSIEKVTDVDEVLEETNEIEFYDPVENNPANTELTPYFEGQTRTNGIKTQTEYTITLFSEGLESPWGIDILPNGMFIVSEKFGTIRL